MDYGLARLVFGSPKFIKLSKQEYEDIKDSRNILLESLFIEQKFDLLIDDYLEFETELLEIGARELVRGSGDWTEFQDQRNHMNRRVVNLLSAARCRIPDDCIDEKRYPLFMARAVLQELIESLQPTTGSAKP